MTITGWLANNWLEVFGAVTGIIYVFLEIRQNIWLWPVGLMTSAVYIIVFFTTKFYADMSLQGYYLVMSIIGWYWWAVNGKHDLVEQEKSGSTPGKVAIKSEKLQVSRVKLRTGIILAAIFAVLYFLMWYVLSRFTDSPVPEWDSFITSLSVVATWMLARKIYEHWYLWILVNVASVAIFIVRGLYPTVILYTVYLAMSFGGLKVWKKSLPEAVAGKN
ncbi:MAG: nicotinamide riboside transporter PnuC [Bacteroidales bacterium]